MFHFNKKYENSKFYILINNEDKINGVRIRDGLNIYKKILSDKDDYGIKIISYKNIIYYIDTFNKYVREIKILVDSKIYKINNYYVIDKFYSEKKTLIKDLNLWRDEDFCIKNINNKNILFYMKFTPNIRYLYKKEIENNPDYLIYINKNKQNYDLCKLAIKNKKELFKYVRKDLQDYKLCKIAVKDNGYNLKYVRDDLKTIDLFNLAINDNIKYFKYVNKDLQTYELCYYAVSEYGNNLKYVKKDLQDYNLCKIAVENNNNVYKYVRKDLKTIKMFLFCDNLTRYFPLVSKKLQDKNLLDLIYSYDDSFYKDSIEYIKKSLHTKKICYEAVNYDFDNFKYIRKDLQDYDLCKLSIKDRKNLNFIRKDLLDCKLFKIIIDKCLIKNEN